MGVRDQTGGLGDVVLLVVVSAVDSMGSAAVPTISATITHWRLTIRELERMGYIFVTGRYN